MPHDKLASIGEAVVLGTDASGAAARQLEHKGLAGATPGRLTDGLPTMRLREDDNGVLASRVGSWAGEQNSWTRKWRAGSGSTVPTGKRMGVSARARGRTGDRPPKLTPKEIKTISALLKSAKISVAEIAPRFDIARSTLFRAILKPAA